MQLLSFQLPRRLFCHAASLRFDARLMHAAIFMAYAAAMLPLFTLLLPPL